MAVVEGRVCGELIQAWVMALHLRVADRGCQACCVGWKIGPVRGGCNPGEVVICDGISVEKIVC